MKKLIFDLYNMYQCIITFEFDHFFGGGGGGKKFYIHNTILQHFYNKMRCHFTVSQNRINKIKKITAKSITSQNKIAMEM